MSPDAPDAGDPGAPSEGPPDGFDPLVEQAEAIRARGEARAASLDAPSTRPLAARRPVGVLLAVLVVLLAGAVIAWVARGDDSGDQVADPVATTVAPSATSPSSTVASSTTVRASTTLEAEPAVPAVPAPPTPTTTPTTPPTEAPPDDGTGEPGSPLAVAHTVVVGESFWVIAEQEVGQLTGGAPTEAQVATYWRVLVDANAGNLVQPGNPNLILPGQVLDVPPVVVP